MSVLEFGNRPSMHLCECLVFEQIFWMLWRLGVCVCACFPPVENTIAPFAQKNIVQTQTIDFL